MSSAVPSSWKVRLCVLCWGLLVTEGAPSRSLGSGDHDRKSQVQAWSAATTEGGPRALGDDDEEDGEVKAWRAAVTEALVADNPPWNVKGNETWSGTAAYVQSSPMLGYLHAILTWLDNPDAPQVAICIVACVFGIMVAAASQWIWPGLVATLTGLLFAGFAHYEDVTIALVGEMVVLQVLMALQVGALLGLAAYLGIEGVQVVLGTAMGLFIGWGTCLWSSMAILRVLWYCLWTLLGALSMWLLPLLVLVTELALLGGLLFAGGLGAALSHFVDMVVLPPSESTLIASIRQLLGPHGVVLLSFLMGLGLLGAIGAKVSKLPIVPVALLALGLFISTIATTTGWGCKLINRCPSWLEPVSSWQWPLIGCTLWALVTCGATFLQARLLVQPGGDLSPEEERLVRRIMEPCGCDRATAIYALRAAGGNADQAAENIMLGNAVPPPTGTYTGSMRSSSKQPQTMRGRRKPQGLSLEANSRGDDSQYPLLPTTRHGGLADGFSMGP
mmetsp:Transcript_62414/g.115873  ORF Transcript_62414/g.115873 Transcript_62414/m.115873 type:complete len:502 (+) Transcript_62414:160-1665(+)